MLKIFVRVFFNVAVLIRPFFKFKFTLGVIFVLYIYITARKLRKQNQSGIYLPTFSPIFYSENVG